MCYMMRSFNILVYPEQYVHLSNVENLQGQGNRMDCSEINAECERSDHGT